VSLLIDDLLSWWAGQASLNAGEDLFAGLAPESGELVSTVRQTGGPVRTFEPTMTATFQVTTRAETLAAAMGRADALYDALYPSGRDRLPWRNVELSDGWRMLAVDALQPPGDLGVGDDGRRRVVFNITVRAAKTA